MPDRRPPILPLFVSIAVVVALSLGSTEFISAGYLRDLVDGGLVIVCLLLVRQAYAGGAMGNPLGADRDFSPAPVLKDLLIGAAFALGAIGWAVAYAMAVRNRLLPDTSFPVTPWG